MNLRRERSGLLVVLGSAVLIFCFLPLGTAFEIGDDEGSEVIKAFMCSKGYKLYMEIWNDQPPVSTMILKTAFHWFGASILTARVVAAGFGLLLLGVFHEMVRLRSGKWPALIGSFLLLAAPSVLLLSVSVMLEAEAFATALLSAWLVFFWGQSENSRGKSQNLLTSSAMILLLVASGAMMGVALQTKLTCVLVAPPIVVELWLACAPRLRPTKRAVQSLLVWGLSLVTVFAIIGFTWGKGALASSWKSHTGVQSVPGMDRPEDHKFDVRLIGQHWECIGAAVIGVVLVGRRRGMEAKFTLIRRRADAMAGQSLALSPRRGSALGSLREIAFPLTLLLTVIAIHSVHRPWWNYYYLHFAIPIAWLAGIAVNEGIQTVLRLFSPEQAVRKLRVAKGSRRSSLFSQPSEFIPLLLLSLAVAFVIARSERRLESSIKSIRARPAADANPIVKAMKAEASETKWVYSEDGIYAFHAKLLVPPEIAIVMPKRFWSGQATTTSIIASCNRYGVAAVVLPETAIGKEWQRFLRQRGSFLARDEKNLLYSVRADSARR